MNSQVPAHLLFTPSLIHEPFNETLRQNGLRLRPLACDDYEKGFLTALSHLTTVGEVTKGRWLGRFNSAHLIYSQSCVERYQYMKAHNHEYFVIVVEDERKGRIAASGTMSSLLQTLFSITD